METCCVKSGWLVHTEAEGSENEQNKLMYIILLHSCNKLNARPLLFNYSPPFCPAYLSHPPLSRPYSLLVVVVVECLLVKGEATETNCPSTIYANKQKTMHEEPRLLGVVGACAYLAATTSPVDVDVLALLVLLIRMIGLD